MTGKTEQESLTEISSKLDSLIRLTALNLVNGIKLQKDKILILDEAGFAPGQIADIVGTSSASVSQTIYANKKEKAAKDKKEPSKETKSEPGTDQENKEGKVSPSDKIDV